MRYLTALLVMLMAAGLMSGCGQIKPENPEETLKLWFKYQEQKEYDLAWAMITPELQKQRGIRGFHTGFLKGGWRGEVERFREEKGLYGLGDESGDAMDLISLVRKWQVEIKGGEAAFTAEVPYRGFDWRLKIILLQEADGWKIAAFNATGYLPPGSGMIWIE